MAAASSDDASSLFSSIAQLLPQALASVITGAAFTSGSLALCPAIRPSTLPQGFSPPAEWTDADYAQVKASLAQAPFGVGTETVVDKTVRDALELSAATSVFDNAAEWQAELNKAIAQFAAKLVPKLPVHQVTAQFYKMVVYEKGGHFAPHRDSQRSATHFGTLVVLLPGKATGGELILRHGGTEATFAIPGGKKKCTFVAYFADVEHEVKPVVKGRRISLLYNLHKPASSPAVCPPPSAPLAVGNSSVAGKHEASENLPPILAHVQTLKRKLEDISSAEQEEEEHEDEDEDDSQSASDTKFIGYICEHAYAGAVNGDTLKGADLAFWHLFKPQNPGTRVAQIEIRMSGPTCGDDAKYIRGPDDFHGCVVEVDEVDASVKPPAAEKSDGGYFGFGSYGNHSFKKSLYPSRPLAAMEHGDASIYGCDLEVPNIAHVRFVNDNGNVFATATRANAAEKSVRGSGNEGSSAAFLYKRMAILVPLTEDAESSLADFSAAHAKRSYPDYLP